MTRSTQPKAFKRQTQPQMLSNSIGILAGRPCPAYTLEYLSGDKKGRAETIVMAYIEIGRGHKCAVRIGEEHPSVHRKHAAILREGDNIRIKHLGNDPVHNPTLINGRPIQKEWFLQNGDVLQFSVGGPMLRFNISPTGTANMSVSRRFGLVAQQAIRPYKTAFISLLVLLLALTGGGGYAIHNLWMKNKEQEEQLAIHVQTTEEMKEKQEEMEKDYAEKLAESQQQIAALQNNNQALSRAMKASKKEIEALKKRGPQGAGTVPDGYEDVYDEMKPYVFCNYSARTKEFIIA